MSEFFYAIHHAPIPKRDGEILGSLTDRELDNFGISMAERQAQKIKNKLTSAAMTNIDLIISSPLKRAVRTSEIIANELGINEIAINGLASAQSFGALENMTFKEIREDENLKCNLWDYIEPELRDCHRAPMAESNNDIKCRAGKLSDEILALDETVLLITHGTVIDAFLSNREQVQMSEIEGKNRMLEGRLMIVSVSSIESIGASGEQFDFMPEVQELLKMNKGLNEIKKAVTSYLDKEMVSAFERAYIIKLLTLAEKYDG